MVNNAMDCIGMDRNGMHSIPVQCIPLDWIALRSPARVNEKRQLGAFTTIGVNDPIATLSNGGGTMANCFICQTELAPPVRTRHTVYVRRLFLLGGQTYCRHHIIPAAVTAGVISEVKASAGPDLA